jgi:simple sugar transport system ATP-binding protein
LTALACEHVTVTYGDVVALHDVSVAFEPARIHAVVGQNGAGKTTFARVCAGIVRPTTGELTVGGKPIRTGDVSASRGSGVELVHQSFALPPSFTVAEAMEFGSERPAAPVFSRKALERRWRDHLESLDVPVKLSDRIRDLPVETQQAVEIARALVSEAKVLILDEPTAVLGPKTIDALFARIRRLQASGVTILVVLHKIREVLAIAETVTVLRAGNLVASLLDAKTMSPADLAHAIIGSESVETELAQIESEEKVAANEDRPAAFAFVEAATAPVSGDAALEKIDIAVRPGEVVGIAGVEGNGQRTLVNAIAGLTPLSAGIVQLGGHDVTRSTMRVRRAGGLRIIPFERNIEGLSIRSALWQNWSIRILAAGRMFRSVNPKSLRESSRKALDAWSVRFGSIDQHAGTLSGGNAQRVVLAREIDEDATLIVAAQPTRGLDVAAMAFVWRALRDARDRGCGVIVISSDLDELFDISDRVIVMVSGHIAGEFRPPYDLAAIGAAMTAAHA